MHCSTQGATHTFDSTMLDLKHSTYMLAGPSRVRPSTNSSAWVPCRRPQCCRCSCAAERQIKLLKVPIAALLSTAMCQPQLAASAAPLSPEQLHARLTTLASIDGRTAGQLAVVLGPLLSGFSLLMIVRIVLSWYPQIDGKKLPWSIAVAPTEPVLGPTRRLIQPVGGVDVSPVRIFALLPAALQAIQLVVNNCVARADNMVCAAQLCERGATWAARHP